MLWQPCVDPDGLQVEVWTAAAVSLGGALCSPPGTWGEGSLWGICYGHLPSPPYFSWGAVLKTVSNLCSGPDELGGFLNTDCCCGLEKCLAESQTGPIAMGYSTIFVTSSGWFCFIAVFFKKLIAFDWDLLTYHIVWVSVLWFYSFMCWLHCVFVAACGV